MEIQLTFSLEEHPAKHSQLQDSGKDLKTQGETSPLHSLEWLTTLSPNGLSGKMSPVYCQATEDGTLVPSSGRWQVSGMGSLGGVLTLNSTASRKDVVESSLSDILQEIQDVPEKYYLSQRACQGIIARANRRGKALPKALSQALYLQSGLKVPEVQPETSVTT